MIPSTRAGTLTWQDPVQSWKAGPGEVMTVESYIIIRDFGQLNVLVPLTKPRSDA